jgi:hypothetical protein
MKEITHNSLNNYKMMFQIIVLITSANNLKNNKLFNILNQIKNR